MCNPDLLLSNYDYHLPETAIAQVPAQPAHDARLLILDKNSKGISRQDQTFFDLTKFLDSRYLLFLNQTKVFKARIPLKNVRIIRKSGKEIWLETGEIFIYSLHSKNRFEALVSDSKNFKPGSIIFIDEQIWLESVEFTENGILFELKGDQLFDFLEKMGEMPLPPYIQYEKAKEERYQTFFAQEVGSAAAPTASLHFTPELVRHLEQKGVNFSYLCLHVGLGTFKPVFEPIISDQKLHFEPMIVPHSLWKAIADAKQSGLIFLPIGTTMVRFLESLPYLWCFLKKKKLTPELDQPTVSWWNNLTTKVDQSLVEQFIPEQKPVFETDFLQVQTRLFLRPGIDFLLVDELISNFHLPKSSLLMLISAFLGREETLEAYHYAIEQDYKFYSFGDGMWIRKK